MKYYKSYMMNKNFRTYLKSIELGINEILIYYGNGYRGTIVFSKNGKMKIGFGCENHAPEWWTDENWKNALDIHGIRSENHKYYKNRLKQLIRIAKMLQKEIKK